MSERPFDPAPPTDRPYGEMRCRRYLFDRAYGEEEQPLLPDPVNDPRLPACLRGGDPELPQ